ncbi:MAG TPA: hypothetical protein VM802_28300 [Chitinophaga sp.]|uniref:hypothetical protein n=1 Tax=Chitinophaga sp. TaxID=1869181 RepID=UPI002C460C5A|nr:hypothetical protein [Chitinophaga sp.]HVI48804.1 hypothetical protein [Chitinophaga sp.]
MKKLILLLAIVSTGVWCRAQEHPAAKTPYHLPQVEGWGTEQFPIPIDFAPSLAYKGVEDIRFSPGWGNSKSEEYWSYSFLWYLDGKQTFTAAIVTRNLEAYYTGLVGRNISKRNIPAEKVVAVKAGIRKAATEKGDEQTFTGTVSMLDYMTQQPILQYCKVHVKSCDDNTAVFHEISPKPYSHSIWTQMNNIWSGFRCK